MSEVIERKPLARGNRYGYKGYKDVGFEVTGVAFRGHPEDDGGAVGVGVKWFGFPKPHGRQGGGWYICNSEKEFFEMLIFNNACNEEDA